MFMLLLQVRIKSFINRFKKTTNRKRITQLVAPGLGIFFFIYLFSFFLDLENNLIFNLDGGQDIFSGFLKIFMMGFFFLLILSSASISTSIIFTSTDIHLLLSSPISTNTIFWFKFLEATFLNSILFIFIGLPLILSSGVTSHAPWFFYPLSLIFILIFLILPSLLGIIFSLYVLKIVSKTRVKEILGTSTLLVTSFLWIGIHYFRASFTRTPSILASLSEFSGSGLVKIMPSSFIVNVLIHLQKHELLKSLLDFFPVLIILFVLTIFIGLLKNSYFETWAAINACPQNRHTKKKKKFLHKNLPSVFHHIFYIIIKDFKIAARDFRQTTQFLIFFLFIFLYPFITKPVETSTSALGPVNFISSFGFIFILSSISSCIFSSQLIPMESRAFYLNLISPCLPLFLILSKLFLGFFVNISLTFIAISFITAIHGINFQIMVLLLMSSFPVILCSCSVGFLFGALFGRFDWEHPKKMLSSSFNMLLLAVNLSCVIFIAALAYFVYQFLASLEITAWLTYLLIFVVSVLLSVLLCIMISFISISHLKKMEWQY